MRILPPVEPMSTFDRDRRTGQLYINPAKKAVREFLLNLDAENAVVPANGLSQVTASVTQDQHFEGYQLMGQSSDAGLDPVSPRCLVQIRSPFLGWNLMNRAIHFDTMMGDNLQPYPLPASLWVPSTQGLVWTFQDFSGAPQTVRAAVEGRGIYWSKFEDSVVRTEIDQLAQKKSSRKYFPYWLTTDAPVVLTTLNQEFPFTITVPSNGDFEAWYITAVADTPFNWTLTDSYSNQFWHNRVAAAFGPDSRISCGTGRFPFVLNEPTVIGANTKLSLLLRTAAFGAGAQTRIYFTIGGRLIVQR